MEPPDTPNHKKSRKVGVQKNIEKQHCKKLVLGRILTSKTRYAFAPEASLKSQKSEKSAKWAPRPPKWAPGPLKYLKKHESDHPKSRKSYADYSLCFVVMCHWLPFPNPQFLIKRDCTEAPIQTLPQYCSRMDCTLYSTKWQDWVKNYTSANRVTSLDEVITCRK